MTGIRIVVNALVPLQRKNRETGEMEDVLAWRIDGLDGPRIHVHPDRLKTLKAYAMEWPLEGPINEGGSDEELRVCERVG